MISLICQSPQPPLMEIIVIQPLISSHFLLSLPPSEELGVSDDEGQSVAIAFLSYVGESSLRDTRLSKEQQGLLYMKPLARGEKSRHAALVGESYGAVERDSALDRLRREVANDPDVRSFIDGCVGSSHTEEASNVTLEMFTTVVQTVLEVDEHGIGTEVTDTCAYIMYWFYNTCGIDNL